MLRCCHPAYLAFTASVLLLAGLLTALYWEPAQPQAGDMEPLVVYCAEALRGPLENCARDYEREEKQKVFLHFGPSQTILTNLAISKQGDLFLPADDSYIKLASERDLLETVVPLVRMKAVVIVRPGFQGRLTTFQDFLVPGPTLALGNPGATAIGKLVREKLTESGAWTFVEKRQPTYMVSVNDVASAVRLGSVDMGVVWDVVARLHPAVTVVKFPEFDAVSAQVQIGLTKFSRQPDAAMRFTRFLRAKDKGARYFIEQGFSDVAEVASARTELLFFAGAMLRPAVEQTLDEFEKREGVRITRSYNGCGILVSQMNAGAQPDVYFACDPRFMDQVSERFDEPTHVSNNQLVIAVRKGNPHGLQALRDLGKPGLKLGIGHEQQCALGALTKESFIKTGVYAHVHKNVVVQSPTGDFLVNQLRSGARSASADLDAIVVYRSNIVPFSDEIDGIPVTGIPCAAPQQPLAVSKTTKEPELSRRLQQALQSASSRDRFEKLGFGWEQK